jgi:hypothetical protein
VQRMPKSREKSTRKRTQHDMINKKKMQWCMASRESNGLVFGRVTHLSERHTVISSINRAAHVWTKEQVCPNFSH